MRTISILDIFFVEYTEKPKNKIGANLFFCKIRKGDKTDITDYVIKSGGFEKSRNGEIIIRIAECSSIIDDYNTNHNFENDIFNIFYDYLKQQFDICKTVKSSIDGDFKNIFDDCLLDYNYYNLLELFIEQENLISEYLLDPATLNNIINSNIKLYDELVEPTKNTTVLINAVDTVECGTLSEENEIEKHFYNEYTEMFKTKILKTVNTDMIDDIIDNFFDEYESERIISRNSRTYYSYKTEKDEYENIYSSSPNIIIHFVKNNNHKLCDTCGYALTHTLFYNN